MSETKRTRRWIQWLLLALLALGLGLGVLRALGKRAAQRETASAAATALQQAPVYEMAAQDLVAVQSLSLSLGVKVSGSLKALQDATVKARTAGELQDLTRREGESVKAGEVLARIDNTEALAKVRQAEQQTLSARAQVAIARRTHDNNQSLVGQGFISATALDTSGANLAAAEATHQAAVAALDIARKGLGDTVLRSPLNGQVAARLAQNGERVGVDAAILELVDLSGFEVEVALSPADAAGVRPGQSARLNVEGLAQPVDATVARINPSVQTGSRNVLVYLRLPATPGMRQGLFVQGRIVTGQLQAAAVPLSAVRNDKPEPYLHWLQDGQVRHQTVPLDRQGEYQGEPMLVLDGLPLGATVLRAGAGAIREGTQVKVAAATAATATPTASTMPAGGTATR